MDTSEYEEFVEKFRVVSKINTGTGSHVFVKLATSTNLEDVFKYLLLNLDVLKMVFLMDISAFVYLVFSK